MTVIAMTGMHRTGTSMIAKALRLAGLYLGEDGDLVEPAPDNPEGFFEHAAFVRLDDDLLEATGGAWDHPPACGPMAADDPRVTGLTPTARELITTMEHGGAWGWKDPRICLTARFWLDLIPDLRFVVCIRHPLEVALSLKRRNQVSYALALSLWHAYYESLLDAVPSDRMLLTHYDAHFHDGDRELDRIVRFAGLAADATAAARSARNPHLRHHHLGTTLAEADVAPATIDLYRGLREDAGLPPEVGARSSGAAHVDRRALDLALANEHLEERGRQVSALQRENERLKARVDAGEPASGTWSEIARVHRRLDVLEDALHRVRYGLESLADRADAPVVRGCRELVRAHVPRSDSVLVIAKGDPALLDLHGRQATNFPADDRGQYPGFPLGDSASAIAHLEAQRIRGERFFLVPRTARWWIDHFSAFAEHLGSRYRVVADDPNVGLLVDVATRLQAADGWPRAVSDVIDRLAAASGCQPAILDWSRLGIGSRLPGRNVFVPPPESEVLPYLDASIDIVLIDDAARREAARRVATVAVVLLERHDTELATVGAVEVVAPTVETHVDARTLVVVRAEKPDPTWLAHLHEAIGEEPVTDVLVCPDTSELTAAAADADVVAFFEEGVLPLPGCFAAAQATLLGSDLAAATAGKLFNSAGSLSAAGACVFADGSWAGIASGSYDASAPWHDYVRDACWGPGMTFFSATVIDKLQYDAGLPAGAAHAVWSAELWSAGFRVLYQPEAAAVRAAPAPADDRERARELVERAWARALPSRPEPVAAGERSWRELLVRDDVGAGWQ